MDKSLFTACRYTGITKVISVPEVAATDNTAAIPAIVGNESEFRTCFNCGGLTHKTVGEPRHTVYDLTVDNAVAKTKEIIPETDLLKQEAFRCSYCAEVLPDYSDFQEVIDAVQKVHDEAVEGVDPGQYPDGSKSTLQEAIDDAKAILVKLEDATIELTIVSGPEDDPKDPPTIEQIGAAVDSAVSSAIEDLLEAEADFKASVIDDPTDFSALITAITEATTLHDNAVEGEDPGQYPIGSKAILKSAIDEAQALADNTEALQSEVNAGIIALATAVQTFEESVIV